MADTSFQIDVGVQAAGVDSAAASLETLTDRLTAAGAASSAAADAVKAGETAYRQAETSADRAAKALERISLAAEGQRGKIAEALGSGDQAAGERAIAKLRELEKRQAEASTKAAAATAAMNAEAAALDKLKTAASSAANEEAKVAKTLGAAKKAASAAAEAQKAAEGTGNARGIASGLGKLGGPLGDVGKMVFGVKAAFDKLGKTLGEAGPYVAAGVVIVSLVAGVAALAVAAISATLAITAWAVGLADAARTSRLLADGIAGSVKGGRELDATVSKLESQVPQTREELLAMASDLSKSGLKGAELSAALEDAAVKAAKLKWGPDFAKQMLSLDVQSRRLQSNLSKIFGGLGIEKLLEGVAKLVALFDSTEVTGNAIKVLFESLFQPIVDALTALVPKAVSTFIQIEILIMKAAIAVKPFASKIQLLAEAFGIVAVLIGGILTAAIVAVLVPFIAFGAALTASIALALWFKGVIDDNIKSVVAFGSSIVSGVGDALTWLNAKFSEVTDFLSSISLVEIGTNMILGLAKGITGAGSAVVSSITGVVSGGVDAAKSFLGIHSPSTRMADEVGEPMGDGVPVGLEKSAGGVKSALETIVTPPDVGGAAGASSSGGASLNLAGATFNFYGVEGAEDAEGRFGGLLTRLIEGDHAQLGGAVASG